MLRARRGSARLLLVAAQLCRCAESHRIARLHQRDRWAHQLCLNKMAFTRQRRTPGRRVDAAWAAQGRGLPT